MGLRAKIEEKVAEALVNKALAMLDGDWGFVLEITNETGELSLSKDQEYYFAGIRGEPAPDRKIGAASVLVFNSVYKFFGGYDLMGGCRGAVIWVHPEYDVMTGWWKRAGEQFSPYVCCDIAKPKTWSSLSKKQIRNKMQEKQYCASTTNTVNGSYPQAHRALRGTVGQDGKKYHCSYTVYSL